jgi:hypothetical protein
MEHIQKRRQGALQRKKHYSARSITAQEAFECETYVVTYFSNSNFSITSTPSKKIVSSNNYI